MCSFNFLGWTHQYWFYKKQRMGFSRDRKYRNTNQCMPPTISRLACVLAVKWNCCLTQNKNTEKSASTPNTVEIADFYMLRYVRGTYVVSFLNQTSIFDWNMARFILKNGHQKDTCYDEIGPIGIPKLWGSMWSLNEKQQLYFDLL